ncbi:MAG: hypothetical protein ABIP55_00035, partial [Tepidisphaeraceae bacterium]
MFLVVANGDTAGSVYRVGRVKDSASRTWYLSGAYDLKSPREAVSATVFFIGRGYVDPQNPASGFAGPAQDIAAYSTLVRLR